MQIIKLIGGTEYLLADEEAEKVKNAVLKGGFVHISNGNMINTSSISRIGSLDKVKSWGGYILRSDGRSFNREGDIIYLDSRDVVEEIEDPKYKTMNIISIKQLL